MLMMKENQTQRKANRRVIFSCDVVRLQTVLQNHDVHGSQRIDRPSRVVAEETRKNHVIDLATPVELKTASRNKTGLLWPRHHRVTFSSGHAPREVEMKRPQS